MMQTMKAPLFTASGLLSNNASNDVARSSFPIRLELLMGCDAMQHFSAATRASAWLILRKLLEWAETGALLSPLEHVNVLAGEDGIILSWVSSGIFCDVEDARATVLQVAQGGSKYECHSKVYDVTDAKARDLLMDFLKAHFRTDADGDGSK